MIAFASLILSLVVGSQPVELLVGEGVSAVVLRLDGAEAARLEGPPWRAEVEFGPELEPHHLEAVALGPEGEEVGRARQWINVPRGQAETSVVLEGGEGGRGVMARVAWRNLFGDQPTEILASFDGRPLSFDAPHRIPLPAFDPERLHFLRVELRFPQGVSSVAEITFGGVFGDQVASELTAVPVVVEGRRLPAVEELQGWFVKDGRALRVLATDEGAEEIVAVVAAGGRTALDRLVGPTLEAAELASRGHLPGARRAMEELRKLRAAAPLSQRQRLRILDTRPVALERDGYAVRIFPTSSVYDWRDGGMVWLISRVRPTGREAQAERLADAVAAAALAAARQNRRRTIVLVLGEEREDASLFAPAQVRRYLERLRVPLAVLRVGGRADSHPAWGPGRRAPTRQLLDSALLGVRHQVARQRIVWLEGAHLPQAIELSPAARGVRLAGVGPADG